MQSVVEPVVTGEYQGGSGIVRAFRILTDAEVTILSERRVFNP